VRKPAEAIFCGSFRPRTPCRGDNPFANKKKKKTLKVGRWLRRKVEIVSGLRQRVKGTTAEQTVESRFCPHKPDRPSPMAPGKERHRLVLALVSKHFYAKGRCSRSEKKEHFGLYATEPFEGTNKRAGSPTLYFHSCVNDQGPPTLVQGPYPAKHGRARNCRPKH